MNDDELPPELSALFDAERRREGPPPGARERVHQALLVSLGVGAGLGAASSASATIAAGGKTAAAVGSGAAAAGGAVGSSGGAAASVAATTAGATTAAAASTATGGALAKGLALALVTAMAGTAGTGVWLARSDDADKPTTVVVKQEPAPLPPSFDPSVLGPTTPVEATSEATSEATEAEPEPLRVSATEIVIEKRPPPPQQPAPARQPAPEPVPAVSPKEKAAALQGERAVLDEARGAVARGDGGAALIALEAHRAQYAQGALVEEREALLVLTLAKLGRMDEARSKAEAFRSTFPRSLMLPAVDNAVR